MKFIRQDGYIYNPDYKDTIKRLKKSNRFKKIEDLTVSQLKDYAKERELTGYSSLTREELISLLGEGD